jgi:hypothetical protein
VIGGREHRGGVCWGDVQRDDGDREGAHRSGQRYRV